MKKTRLAACLVAATVTLANAAFLATPARAADTNAPCSATQMAYAQGYGDSACGGGYGSSTVTRCDSDSEGNFSFGGYCNDT